ncbi:hypothetical protein ES703_117953 [subsurface metagenome]
MAVSLSKLIADRRAYMRHLKRLEKAVDTELEKAERKIKQILARKIKVPEESDLEVVAGHIREMLAGAVELSRALESGFPL